MYKKFLYNEIKQFFRDAMLLFCIFLPLLFALVGRYVIPALADTNNFSIDMIADYILVALTVLTPLIFGFLIGFSIIDDRDDNILTSIKVTPLTIHKYLSFRVVVVTIMAFLGSVFILWFSDIGNLNNKDIWLISFLACLTTPLIGLFTNIIASNKIEGFAALKGIQIALMAPLISLYFVDFKELFFSFIPSFWPAKVISTIIRGEQLMYLTYNQYYLIGLVYVIILNMIIYRLFMKKVVVS